MGLTAHNVSAKRFSLAHFQALDKTITQKEIDEHYGFRLSATRQQTTDEQTEILVKAKGDQLIFDELKANRELKLRKPPLAETLANLVAKGAFTCVETYYDCRITKYEACLLQGFPPDYKLPESRARWMKLVGNSVSLPVIETLCRAITATRVFLSGSGGAARLPCNLKFES